MLVERGYVVRAQYRRSRIPTHLEEIHGRGAELQRGDLTVLEDVKSLVKDARISFSRMSRLRNV
jgi:hypothetical protein